MKVSELYDNYFHIEKLNQPYRNSREHLEELFSFLDLCFAAAMSARGLDSKKLLGAWEAGRLSDLSVSVQDIERLVAAGNGQDHTHALTEEALEQIGISREHIRRRIRVSRENGMIPRFELLKIKFRLDSFESFAMLLALSVQYDRKYEGIYVWLHNNNGDMYPTKWLALRLYESLMGETPASASRMMSGSSALCRFLCSRELSGRDRSEASDQLVLSRRVTAYLMGSNDPDPRLSGFCSLAAFRKEVFIPFRDEVRDQILRYMVKKGFRQSGCFVFGLYGPEGIGRTTLICSAASVMGMQVLRISLDHLLQMKSTEREKYLDMIYTETVLIGAFPCFVTDSRQETEQTGEEAPAGREKDKSLSETAAHITRTFHFLFWLTHERDSVFLNTGAEFISEELPMLTANERYLFWKAALPEKDEELMSYANRYILTPGSITGSASLASELAAAQKKSIDDSHMTRAVQQHSVNQLGSYATRINAVFTWDDLVVSDEQKRRMKMICDQVRYRSIVNEDWGFRKRSPYGRGLCALFYGSPGTGKTMAVQVMANELGLDLYRIDLSQLTSKYIGETQKNISRLFDKAKNINAMLFFDEADAMFAKRSEVKDSNDRYANADTAFLLQKLEDHEGITILATNYVNNIDDAFKRRIRFMINFVFPTPEVRLQLWKKILPEAAKTDEALDFEFYADHFELSGSNIKEILTNAAYLAAAQGTGIRNCHIIEAIKLNFSKYGKILTNSDFGYLANL